MTTIGSERPDSLTELAELAGNSKSNLSRTLKTMSRYGLVELKGERGILVLRVPYDQVRLDASLTAEPREAAGSVRNRQAGCRTEGRQVRA